MRSILICLGMSATLSLLVSIFLHTVGDGYLHVNINEVI
jgi:hypothetical protein